MIAASFCCFLLIFLAIGMLAAMHKKDSNKDYLLAGSDVKPWLAGLSAVASSCSGFMFVGMIGSTYLYGLSSMWLGIGFVAGDYIASFYTHRRVRVITEEQQVLSFSGVLCKWHGTDFRRLRFVSGIITLLFMGTYAAAQFLAGSKALHVLFGWNYNTGAIIGAVMVFLYCMAGGIRASIWTDAAQSVVMFLSMFLLCVIGVHHVGGLGELWRQLGAIGPAYVALFPADLQSMGGAGYMLFVIGWLFGGFGVIGQPHIMVRFMTVDKPENMNLVRVYYYVWYASFYVLTVIVGLVCRAMLPETGRFDAELALPMLAQLMFPDILVGLVLAGLFAATMSTADSQVISCSAAITMDLLPGKTKTTWHSKLATLAVTFLALSIVLFGVKKMITLSMIGWSILGVAFGPLLFIYTLGKKVGENTAIAMMIFGVATSLAWRAMDLSPIMYDIAPGMIMGLLVYFGSAALPSKPAQPH